MYGISLAAHRPGGGGRSESQSGRGKRAVPKAKVSRRRRPRRNSSIRDPWCEACLALHGRDMLWTPELLALIYVTACTAYGRGGWMACHQCNAACMSSSPPSVWSPWSPWDWSEMTMPLEGGAESLKKLRSDMS